MITIYPKVPITSYLKLVVISLHTTTSKMSVLTILIHYGHLYFIISFLKNICIQFLQYAILPVLYPVIPVWSTLSYLLHSSFTNVHYNFTSNVSSIRSLISSRSLGSLNLIITTSLRAVSNGFLLSTIISLK